MKKILIGILLGFGKIIPGVSGSVIAMSLGIYEECVNRIRYFYKNIIDNCIYFLPLIIGFFISIICGSKMIIYCLKNYNSITISLFIGLIIGCVPTLTKEINLKSKKFYIIFLLIVLTSIYLFNMPNPKPFIFENNFSSYLNILIIGMIEGITMIVPGLSGTAIFMMLGYYDFLLYFFTNVFYNLGVTFLFFISLLISIYITSSIIDYLLKKHKEVSYSILLGLLFLSIISLFKLLSFTKLFQNIISILIGFLISLKMNK